MQPGSVKLLVFYRAVEDEALGFSVRSNSGSCGTTNGVPFACSQSGDVDALGSGRAAIAKLVIQPWDSLQYYVSAGVGDYDLKVPSITVTNLLTGDKPGSLFAAGLKWVFIPDTVVTPALAVDASVTRSRYYLSKQFPSSPPAAGNITQRLDMLESQVAVQASHLFTVAGRLKLEPYGGVKWSYVWSDLKNLVDGSHAAGGRDSTRPFFGLRVPIFDHETLFAEAAFVNGTQFASGVEVRF